MDATTFDPELTIRLDQSLAAEAYVQDVALGERYVAMSVWGNGEAGQAVVYDATTGDHLYTFTAPEGTSTEWFGRTIALNDDFLIVGTQHSGLTQSIAFAYSLTNGRLTHEFASSTPYDTVNATAFDISTYRQYTAITSYWDPRYYQSETTLTVYDTATGSEIYTLAKEGSLDFFGWSVDLDSQLLVTGSYFADRTEGSVDIYSVANGSFIEELKASDPGPQRNFGSSVSLTPDTVVVGASGNGGPDTGYQLPGSVYVFDRDTLQEQQKIELDTDDEVGRFGWRVEAEDDFIVVGDDSASTVLTRNVDSGTMFDLVDFETGIGQQVREATLTTTGIEWSTFEDVLEREFELVDHLALTLQLGIDVNADATLFGAEAGGELAGALGFGYHFGELLDTGDDYWRVTAGISGELSAAATLGLSGEMWLEIPVNDQDLVRAGFTASGGIGVGGEVSAALYKGVGLSVGVGASAGVDAAIDVYQEFTHSEFLSITGADNIILAALDSFGLYTADAEASDRVWIDAVANAVGTTFTPFGPVFGRYLARVGIDLLDRNDPISLLSSELASGGEVLFATRIAETADQNLRLAAGGGLGAKAKVVGAEASANVFAKVTASTSRDLAAAGPVPVSLASLVSEFGSDVSDNVVAAEPMPPLLAVVSQGLTRDDRDVFAFYSAAGEGHQIVVSSFQTGFDVAIQDASGMELTRSTVQPFEARVAFNAASEGVYYVIVEDTRGEATGTNYSLRREPGFGASMLGSGLVDWSTSGSVSLVEDAVAGLVAWVREASPSSMSRAVAVPDVDPRLTFDRRWVSEGDGDTLRVRIDGEEVWSAAIEAAESGFSTVGPIDLSDFAGQVVDLEFYLDSVGAEGAGFEIGEIAIAGDLLPPATPADVEASQEQAEEEVVLTWAPSNDALSYAIYRSITDVFPEATVLDDEYSGTRFEDATVSSGNTYFYWIAAASPAGTSEPSTAVSVTVRSGDALPRIGSLTAMPDEVFVGEDVTLTAAGVDDDGEVMQVDFFRGGQLLGSDTDGGDGWSWLASTGGLTAGTYFYSAIAIDDGGQSSLEATAQNTVLAAPVNELPVINEFVAQPNPVTSGEPLTLAVLDADDPDGTVVAVRFFDAGGNLLGEDADGSDGFSIVTTATGDDVLPTIYRAAAVDDEGAQGPTAEVLVDVQSPGPILGGLSVLPATVEQGQELTLTVTGFDSRGFNVFDLTFFRGGESLGSVNPGIGELSLTVATDDLAPGSYTFSAIALNENGVASNEVFATATVVETVVPELPTIGELRVIGNVLGEPIVLEAVDVQDTDGFVERVEFFNDSTGTFLGSDTDGSDGWTIDAIATGDDVTPTIYRAVAVDNDGNRGPGRTVAVTFQPPVVPPTITSVDATPNPVVQGNDLTLTAVGVSDSDGFVQSVSFFRDGEFVGSDALAFDGFSLVVPTADLSPGSYTFSVIATDETLNDSEPVFVSVEVLPEVGNVAPVIGGLSATPDPVTQGDAIVLEATGVTGADGDVLSVTFSFGSVVIGTDTKGSDGWSATFDTTGIEPGVYEFSAVATDDLGLESDRRFANATVVEQPVEEDLAFTFLDADADTRLVQIEDGATYTRSELAANLSIEADNVDGDVESVAFRLEGPDGFVFESVENNSFYTLFANLGGDYFGRDLSAGTYTLTATSYAENNAGGAAGESATVMFTIVDDAVPDRSIASLTLFDADSDEAMIELTDGAVVSMSEVPTNATVLATVADPLVVESVRFELRGPGDFGRTHVEEILPYTLFENLGQDFFGNMLPAGTHTLSVTTFSKAGATGEAGETLTITFTITV